jgi:hypothetical protein
VTCVIPGYHRPGRELFSDSIAINTDSLIGPISFDARGDVVPRPVTILRADRGGGPMVIAGTAGATIDRVIEP